MDAGRRGDTRRNRRYDYNDVPEAGAGEIVRRIIGVFGELLITCGVVILLFIAWQLWWTDVEADREQDVTVNALKDQFKQVPAKPGAPRMKESDFSKGQFFAIVRVARWGEDYARPVVRGTTHDDLSRGIGHTNDSAMPGEIGNFATAAHRTTYGKPYARIHELQPGDYLVVETKDGYYGYKYVRHRIVLPSEWEVQAPVPDKPGVKPTERWMTMVSCHPPFSASQRYIGYAKLEAFVPRGKQVPAQWMKVSA